MWKPIDGRVMDLKQLQAHIDTMPATIWASGTVLHNTGAPSLSQRPQGLTPQHMQNLVSYFRDDRGWSSGPHCFVDDQPKPFKLFTKFTDKGTHSPSWNGTKIGIEMLGDFRPGSDDDDAGRGMKVKLATVALFAMLHTKYGWDPQTIKLHKEDPRTTHDCPGKDVDKAEFISLVEQYMGHAGEHPSVLPTEPPPAAPTWMGTVKVPSNDVLNLRDKPSASGKLIKGLPPGAVLTIFSSAMNGPTKWLRVQNGTSVGWVSAKFVKE